MAMNILSVVIVLGVLYGVLCLPVALFNLKVYQAVVGVKCGFPSVLLAFCPFYNIVFARKQVYTKAPIYNILLILCAVLLCFRFISLVMVARVPILVFYSAFCAMAAVVLYYILYIINAVDFAHMFGCGAVTKLMAILVAPVGYYLLSNQVLSYYKSVEDEVSGRFAT